MAAALVQSKSGSGQGVNSVTVTLDNPTTTGNALLVVYSCYYATEPYTSISDNASPASTFTASPGDVSTSFQGTLCIASALNITGRSGHAVTVSRPSQYYIVTVLEVSGLATSSALDKTHANNSLAANYTSGLTATTAQADEFLLGAHAIDNISTLTAVPATGWTALPAGQRTDGSFHRHYLQTRVVSATGTYESSGTVDHFDQSAIATYKAAAGGGTANTLTVGGTLAPGGTTGKAVAASRSGTLVPTGTLAPVRHFTHYKTITIDRTQCGSANSTDFPVTLLITHADLATIANGGKVTSASGYDIRPYDSTRAVPLDYELVAYAPTTGAIEMHVRVPTLSVSADTVFTLCFGDSGLTADGSSSSTWRTAYKAVLHLRDNAATTVVLDATSNANHATNVANTSGKSTTGQLGKALTYNGSTDQTVLPNIAALHAVNQISVSAWVKFTTLADFAFVVGESSADGSSRFGVALSGPTFNGNTALLLVFGEGPGASSSFAYTAAGLISTGVWYHVVGTYDTSQGTNATRAHVYLNGVDKTLTFNGGYSPTAPVAPGTDPIRLATDNRGVFAAAVIDEARAAAATLSASWVLAEYNNQRTQTGTGDFFALGATTAVGGTANTLTLSGAIAPTGSVTKATSHATSGSCGATGTVRKTSTHATGGTLAVSGTVTKVVGRTLPGALTATGTCTKAIANLLGGTLTPTGSVSLSTASSTGARVSQLLVETLSHPSPDARTTQLVVETLSRATSTVSAVVTQLVVETLAQPLPSPVRVSQSPLEILEQVGGIPTRVSQSPVEVLEQLAAPLVFARVSQAALEIIYPFGCYIYTPPPCNSGEFPIDPAGAGGSCSAGLLP